MIRVRTPQKPKIPQQPKYFMYVRRSQDSEDRQLESIADQITEATALAKRDGLEIVDIISESKSAKAPGRPQFNAMMQRIQKGEANGIVCWDLDRLARNPIDAGQISWMLQQGIIRHIRTHDAHFWPSDNVIIMQFKFGMANQYVKDLSQNIQRGMRNKALRGWYPISRLPVGYKVNPHFRDKSFRKGIDPEIVCDENYKQIRALWKMMLTGQYSVADMVREGKRRCIYNMNTNRPLASSTYYLLFSDEFYCGYFWWKDKDGNQVRIKGKHKAMVTENEFDRVQEILGKRTQFKVNKSACVIDFPFRGPLSCGECGCMISAEQKIRATCTACKRKFSLKNWTACPDCGLELAKMSDPVILNKKYYRCTRKRGKCSQPGIEEQQLQAQIVNALHTISLPESFVTWAKQQFDLLHEEEQSEDEEQLSKLQDQETRLLSRKSNFSLMRADGEISAEEFETQRTTIQKELRAISVRREQLQEGAKMWTTTAKAYLTFAQHVVHHFENGDVNTKRKILSVLGSNLTLMNKTLCFEWQKPLVGIKDFYLGVWDGNQSFEPQKVIVEQGKMSIPDTRLLSGWTRIKEIRTTIMNNVSEFSEGILQLVRTWDHFP